MALPPMVEMPPRAIKREARRDAEGITPVAAVVTLRPFGASPGRGIPEGNSSPAPLTWGCHQHREPDSRRDRQNANGAMGR